MLYKNILDFYILKKFKKSKLLIGSHCCLHWNALWVMTSSSCIIHPSILFLHECHLLSLFDFNFSFTLSSLGVLCYMKAMKMTLNETMEIL